MRIVFPIVLAAPLWAQNALSLKDAVRTALDKHPSVEAAGAQVKAAAARVEQARGGRLPKLNYIESWQRSDNPVFVFSSLLTQHQFAEQNFALGPLNRPDALNNFQSQVTLDQSIWDAGATKAQIRSAELGHDAASEDRRLTRMDVIAAVIRAYCGALLSEESLAAAREAVKSAEADLERAEAVRTAGMATDADVLAIRVHLAGMKEQEIRRGYDVEIARAALNEALGTPLDTRYSLSTTLAVLPAPENSLPQEESEAERSRPEARQLRLMTSLAETQSQGARASLLPQFSFRVAFEADRQRLINRGGANWFAGAFLRWNIFNGYADKARVEEASQALVRSKARQRQMDSAIRLQVRSAWFNVQSAQDRFAVAGAAVAEAEENLRIVKNRYEAGMTNVTELLRSETALLEAKVRRLSAIHDQRLAAAALERAAGSLTEDSRVLN